jgi:hypothetical protein
VFAKDAKSFFEFDRAPGSCTRPQRSRRRVDGGESQLGRRMTEEHRWAGGGRGGRRAGE